MNDVRKFDILGLIDDELTDAAAEQRMRFEKKEKKRMNFKVAALLAAVLALISAMVFALPALIDRGRLPVETQAPPAEEYYSLSEINPQFEYGMPCFTGHIGPRKGKCYPVMLNEADIKKMFGLSELPFEFDFREHENTYARTHVEYYEEGGIYEIYLRYRKEDKQVFDIIINPSCLSDFDTLDGDKALSGSKSKVINGYTVGITEWRNGSSSLSGYISIHMGKDGVGIWILGRNEYRAEIEAVYNMILNSDIDFSALEK